MSDVLFRSGVLVPSWWVNGVQVIDGYFSVLHLILERFNKLQTIGFLRYGKKPRNIVQVRIVGSGK